MNTRTGRYIQLRPQIYAPKVQIKVERLILFVLGLLFNWLLLTCYYYFISPSYEYLGLITRDVTLSLQLINLFISLLPLLWLPLTCGRPSDYTVWMLYILLVAPYPNISVLVSRQEPMQAINASVAILVGFTLIDLARKPQYFKFKKFFEAKQLFAFWLPLVTVLLSFFVFALAGFHLNLSFSDVYERRFAARDIAIANSLTAYLIAMLQSVCLPFTLVIGIFNKKWLYIIESIFATLAIFGFEGSKVVILVPLLIMGVIYLSARCLQYHSLIILLTVCLIILLAILETKFLDSDILSTIFVRRLLVIPSQLSSYYLEFFSKNPYALFSDNLLSYFIPARYSLPIPRVIGEAYFGNIATNANTGIWATGFAQLGYLGIVLFSMLGGVILSFIDSITIPNRSVMGSVISMLIGLIWSQTGLHTSILTNGVGGLLLGLYLYPVSLSTPLKTTQQLATHAYPQNIKRSLFSNAYNIRHGIEQDKSRVVEIAHDRNTDENPKTD